MSKTDVTVMVDLGKDLHRQLAEHADRLDLDLEELALQIVRERVEGREPKYAAMPIAGTDGSIRVEFVRIK